MTFVRNFVFEALALLIMFSLYSRAWGVPLHPETEFLLRAKGQFEDARAALAGANVRGANQPTPFPIDIRAMRDMDRTELHVLTILVDFDDNPADSSLYPAEHYEQLLYSVSTFATGSLRDYYLENSCGDVHIVGEVAGWYRMPYSYSYYVSGNYGFGLYPNNAQKLTEDAVYAANSEVDFSVYDNDGNGYVDAVFVVHAGPGAEQTGSPNDIWSHAWATHNVPYVDGVFVYSYSQEPEDGHIGVFGHELGHALFGLPDLYDYNYDSHGTGMWSMMSVGTWGGGGVTPVHLDAWSKIKAGFVDPVVVESDETAVSIPQVETSGVIYRLWTEGEDGQQYFLVENRQQVGFDASLPGSGLLIYHIEEQWGSNNFQWYPGYTNYGHYLVAVEQADGDWDLEHNYSSGDSGDPWPGSASNATFDAYSIPDSKNYDFGLTSVAVRNISPSAEAMSADFEVGIFIQTGREVVLTPEQPNINLPDEGGRIEYHAEVVNHDPFSVQVDFWVNAVLPDGSLLGPLTGPHGVTLPGEDVIEADLTQIVPARAPSGQYSLIGYVGTYPSVVEDSSFFYFSKGSIPSAGISNPRMDGWLCEGGFTAVKTIAVENFDLISASPNPFNPTTVLRYKLQDASFVNLSVYDISGRKVAELVDGWREAGRHEVAFDAARLASGVYLYRLEADGYEATGKMMLLK